VRVKFLQILGYGAGTSDPYGPSGLLKILKNWGNFSTKIYDPTNLQDLSAALISKIFIFYQRNE
jgi:hypothetical protein